MSNRKVGPRPATPSRRPPSGEGAASCAAPACPVAKRCRPQILARAPKVAGLEFAQLVPRIGIMGIYHDWRVQRSRSLAFDGWAIKRHDDRSTRESRQLVWTPKSGSPPSSDFDLIKELVVFHVAVWAANRYHAMPVRDYGDQKIPKERRVAQVATAASIASPNHSTIMSIAALSMMNGGASSTWSPRLPSTVPPIG